MQAERLRADQVPPRAASSASSYYTTLDRFATPTDSVESLASPSLCNDSSGSSAPSSPEPAYDLIQRRREGTALVIQHPTLVNFVPTSDIQTAVRVLPDCVVIDTILPPTATLRASDLAIRHQQNEIQPAEGPFNTRFDAAKLLEEHKQEIYQTLTTKLSENYDPTGTIKEEIFTTLTQLTRFPDPKGTNKSQYTQGQCPCICCEMGCSNPLEPHSSDPTASVAASSTTTPNRTLAHTGPVGVSASGSFLEMTEASSDKFTPMRGTRDDDSRSKPRFGLFRLKSFGRSRSQVDLAPAKVSTAKRSSVTALPAAAPALPEQVTAEVVPPGSKPTRSRSFSDLVRRRRKKHMAATFAEEAPPLPLTQSSTAQDKAKATRTMDDGALRLPVRSSSQTGLATNTRATAGPGRYSLDSARVDTPFEGPQPPPRRSSKLYAIVGRKPVPQLNASLSAGNLDNRFRSGSRNAPVSMSRNGRSVYEISQILEEDEGAGEELLSSSAGRTDSKSRRQSALISDFGLISSGSLDNDPRRISSRLDASGSASAGPAWAFRSVRADRSADPNIATPETQVGVAL